MGGGGRDLLSALQDFLKEPPAVLEDAALAARLEPAILGNTEQIGMRQLSRCGSWMHALRERLRDMWHGRVLLQNVLERCSLARS